MTEFGFKEAKTFIKGLEDRTQAQKIDDAVDLAVQEAKEDGGRRWLSIYEGTRILEGVFRVQYDTPTSSPIYKAVERELIKSSPPIMGSISRRLDPESLKVYLKRFTPRKEKA